MNTSRTAALLPLGDWELHVVLDALVAYADHEETQGDPMAVAPIADDIAERLRGLAKLSSVEADQLLRSVGLGRYANRPQG